MNLLTVIDDGLYVSMMATGSSVICDPPVLDTDRDYVIYTQCPMELEYFLIQEGFTTSCEDKEEYDLQETDSISCYRKDNINLIVTTDKKFYQKWENATNLAKDLNLLEKVQRIRLFQYILYDR